MVVVGGGSPQQADAASFPLALPREDDESEKEDLSSSSSSSSLVSGGPFEVFSSLFRALEAAAAGGSGGFISPSPERSFLLSSEGSDAPLAEKKKKGNFGGENDDDDEEEEEEDDEDESSSSTEQQQEIDTSSGEELDLPEGETTWLSSFSAENAGENERALLDDELSRRISPSSSFSSSVTSFLVDDRHLGLWGFALLCTASGAAWVATVSAVKRERRRISRERGRESDKEDEDEFSPSLLEPLAGGPGRKGGREEEGGAIDNPLYYGVVSAADFVERK